MLYENHLIRVFHIIADIQHFTKPVESFMAYLGPTKKYCVPAWNYLQLLSKK